jgi:transglutaminase-like putative cysteine protease
MIPQTDSRQQIKECVFHISPECEVFEDTDAFGNKYIYGLIEAYHKSFQVDISGTAVVDSESFEKVSEKESEKIIMYRYQSAYTKPGDMLRAYYAEHAKEVSESDTDFVTRIMHCIHGDMEYTKNVTDIDTTAEMALSIRKGVCQDYAHIMISILRMAGIPARYAVGMMKGEGFSHAWVEAALSGKWVGFDPTNDNLVDDTYIKISSGRDYQDCIVNRGFFNGCVTQEQNIKVVVSEV